MAFVLIVAAALCCAPAYGLALGMSSRIIGEHSGRSTSEQRSKIGDGPGRPLYAFDIVEAPASDDESGKTCLAVSMTDSQAALKVSRVTPTQRRPYNSVAWGCFTNSLNTTGWNNLVITSTDDTAIPLVLRAYSAGVVEGILTSQQIADFNKTVAALLKKDTEGQPAGAAEAVDQALRRSMIAWEELSGGDAASEPQEQIPRQAWAAMLQVRGMRDGYNMLASQDSAPTLSMFQLTMMNMHAEIPAITELYSRSEQAKILEVGATDESSLLQDESSLLQIGARTRRLRNQRMGAMSSNDSEPYVEDAAWQGTPKGNWPRWASHMPRGAVLVKRLGPEGTPTDMLTGHVTFGNYGEMNRIMKTYKVNFDSLVGKIVMSSYPACVSSTDDYFISEKGFVVMSTNLGVPPSGKFALPAKRNNGVAAFVRAIIATRVAAEPRMWGRIYGFISGIAGAKQWVVADYAHFCQKNPQCQPINNGTVFLFESLPTIERFGDVSEEVHKNGFFEAHGVPHFKQIREIFGLTPKGPGAFEEKLGSALIDQGSSVSSLAMAREVFQQVQNVRTSLGTGISQTPVATRDDQEKWAAKMNRKRIPEGGIDVKLTTRCLIRDMQAQIVSRPAIDAQDPAFQWNTSNLEDWPHHGVPNRWDFAWQNFAETGVTSPVNDDLAHC